MLRDRLGRYVDRIRGSLRDALLAEHSPRQIAASFALGTFVTMLPTLGTGLLLFVVLGRLVDSINEVALYASVLVFNPAVKWGVYVLSVALGILLLGPVDDVAADVAATDVTVETGEALLVRLLVGNLLLAVVATALAYVVAYRLAVQYERSEVGEIVDDALHDIAETVGEP